MKHIKPGPEEFLHSAILLYPSPDIFDFFIRRQFVDIVPKSRLKGVVPKLLCGVAFKYFYAVSKCLCHSSGRGRDNFISNGITVRLILSTCPLALSIPL
ncbi:hypothetical protein RF55_16367 [Lasius niger]|uniref:Uncharacterized protein n=1 Tax=Lasius niger TaxID=67767 RepID=A0A0J7MXQ6_LASNI|nr:hypothetical protein RF55_16367 [Lasius niger]